MSPLLDIDSLTVDVATPTGFVSAVRDVSFRLERGETLGLVGESGCGKSMTGLAVLGLLPDAGRARGRILVDGVDLLTQSERELCRRIQPSCYCINASIIVSAC